MDLKNIPIIDTHGHAFDPEREISDFRTYFNQSLWLPPMDIVKNTLINCTLIEKLKEALGLDGDTDQEDVVLERNKRYKASPSEYIKKLMEHAKLNIEKIYIDIGFPCEAFNGYSVDLVKFSALMNMKIGSIYRLDISVCRILEELPLTFEEAISILKYDLDKAIKIDKVSGIKSFIAYETGLDIRKYTAKEASLAYNRFRSNENKWDEKILQDYFVVEALKKCCEHGLPMQFHTGLGSPPIVKLSQANPILMEDILADKEIRETKVMFLHSGLPFTAQAGYMTSVYPNCYCDLSGILVNFGIAFKKAFTDLLVYGASSRITFGSDGIMVPETYWLSYAMGLKLLGDVFDEMVSGGWMHKKEALSFAEMIINKNAKRIFGE
jgi:uncharacterized protein